MKSALQYDSRRCHGSGYFFYRAEWAQGLQGRSRVRDRGVAAGPGGFRPFPDVRSACVSDESICHRSDSRVSSRVLYVIHV